MNLTSRHNLDPRTNMLLLILAVVFAFSNTKLYMELIFIGSIFVLMYWMDIKRMMLQMLIAYLFLTGMQVLIIPNVNVTVASMLSVLVYFKLIFPCGAAAALFIGTTPVRVLLEAFRRMHIPLAVSVSVAVSARYFPALKDDAGAIWNAMRLRNIKGFEQKLECMYVPLLMSAVKTGEELAQSAIIRGIENPGLKSSMVEIRFRFRDIAAFSYFVLLIIISIIEK